MSSATGFVVESKGVSYLVTNWHVVTGKNPTDGTWVGKAAVSPDSVIVSQNVAGQLGSWVDRKEELNGGNGARWLQHPTLGSKVDVVALPLAPSSDVELFPYELEVQGPRLATGVASDLQIIGFPFGKSGDGRTAIWVRGSIATEPQLDFDQRPCFLVDSRTRSGQSGSPVIVRADGTRVYEDGSVEMSAGSVEQLVGVYSGRINERSDLGMVWRLEALREILNGGTPGSYEPT